MAEINLADLEAAHARWCEVMGQPDHYRYFIMSKSFAMAAGDTDVQWADNRGIKICVSDQMARLVQQLLSPHYVAIIKAHAARLGLEPDTVS